MAASDGHDASKRDHSAADTARTLLDSVMASSDAKEGAVQRVPDIQKQDALARPEAESDQAPKTVEAGNRDAAEYPTGAKLFLISLSLCLSIFLTALVSRTVSRCLGTRLSLIQGG